MSKFYNNCIKNWRWWLVLPYLIVLYPVAMLMVIAKFLISAAYELSKNKNRHDLFFIKRVHRFVRSGRKPA